MDVQALRALLMWCAVINEGLLILALVVCACAGDRIYSVYRRCVPASRHTFNAAVCSLFGSFKVLIVAFNVVPVLVLLVLE